MTRDQIRWITEQATRRVMGEVLFESLREQLAARLLEVQPQRMVHPGEDVWGYMRRIKGVQHG